MDASHTPPATPPASQSAQVIARDLRAAAWAHGARAVRSASPLADASATDMGHLPALVAAVAHAIEARDGDEQPLGTVLDAAVRAVAAEHVAARAAAGWAPHDLVAELLGLRRALVEQVLAGAYEHGADAIAHIERLLDDVLLLATDTFISTMTSDLVRRAERDPLTGLFNRAAFAERAAREIARARRFGHSLTVVGIDLDAFKEVNDTAGHATGDALLTRVARAIESNVRDSDIVGRLGGDEFAVLMVEADDAAAMELARRVRIHLAPARRQLALPAAFGLSIGAAMLDRDGADLDALLHAADVRMYEAKVRSRGGAPRPMPAAQEAAGTEGGAGAPDARLRALIVDDESGVRSLSGEVLARAGFVSVEAGTLAEARDALASGTIDVVLLDVGLAGESGWDLLPYCAQDHQPAVVLMTGRRAGEIADQAVDAGVHAFVAKPFDPETLVDAVHDALEQVTPVTMSPSCANAS